LPLPGALVVLVGGEGVGGGVAWTGALVVGFSRNSSILSSIIWIFSISSSSEPNLSQTLLTKQAPISSERDKNSEAIPATVRPSDVLVPVLVSFSKEFTAEQTVTPSEQSPILSVILTVGEEEGWLDSVGAVGTLEGETEGEEEGWLDGDSLEGETEGDEEGWLDGDSLVSVGPFEGEIDGAMDGWLDGDSLVSVGPSEGEIEGEIDGAMDGWLEVIH
jgi:hypothetical protein